MAFGAAGILQPTGKASDYNNRLLSINSGLPWRKVAFCFGLLGFPGRAFKKYEERVLIPAASPGHEGPRS